MTIQVAEALGYRVVVGRGIVTLERNRVLAATHASVSQHFEGELQESTLDDLVRRIHEPFPRRLWIRPALTAWERCAWSLTNCASA